MIDKLEPTFQRKLVKLTQENINRLHEEAGYKGRVRTVTEVQEFDTFLLNPEFAGYRLQGNARYWLMRYDRPSSVHGGPTCQDCPDIMEAYLPLLKNIDHLIPAA